MPRKPRWGRLSELSGIRRVGDSAYNASPLRIKKLSTWRRLHKVLTHRKVHNRAAKLGVSPSSNMTLKQMRAVLKQAESK